MDGVTTSRDRLDPALDVRFAAVAVTKGNPFGTVRRLRAALEELRPDVLLTHNWGSIEWGLANRFLRPLVRHVHVEDGFGPEEQDQQLRRRVLTRRVALSRATVVLPSHCLTATAKGVWRLDPTRVFHVPNGIDLARFAAPPAGPPPWRLEGTGPVVGTVAALRPEKNLSRLLHALAATDGLRLAIVGDGPERARLEALAVSLGLSARVAFAGHLANPAAAYRYMDIFALSSDTEQMPLSILEAMAAGLPVATTNVGDVAVMLADQNQPFVVPRDDSALSGALSHLAAHASLRRALGEANRAKAARDYDQQMMLGTWGKLLKSSPTRLPSEV
jgi:glycosyltransferase involved in cell wall biosynthesis